MTKKLKSLQDQNIALFLKKELPKERKDPWFTRKVLNRLPPPRPSHSIYEKWLVLITAIGVMVGLIFEAVHIGTTEAIVIGDLVLMGFFMFSFILLGIWILWPIIKLN